MVGIVGTPELHQFSERCSHIQRRRIIQVGTKRKLFFKNHRLEFWLARDTPINKKGQTEGNKHWVYVTIELK